jgi:dienelactone hydrolase
MIRRLAIRWLAIRWLAMAVLVLSAGTAAAQPVAFPSIAVGSSEAGPEIRGWIYKPAGDGPFPAVILAHSCSGTNPHTESWGRRLVGWGYLVLAPDSFNPRGTKAVCTTPRVVTPNMRVADIAGALDFLATRPDAIRGKVGIIGHSHGGSTVIRAAQKSFGLAQRGLAGGVAYYPGCNPQFDTGVDIPLLLLAADQDDWTPADRCRRMVADLARSDLVEAVFYPNAHHGFDSMARDRTVPGAGGRMHQLAYDSAAAPDAEARTKAFFARVLR